MRTKRTFLDDKQTDQIKWQREVIISEMHDTKTDERMKQLKGKDNLTDRELAEAKVITELATDFFGGIADSILTDESREYFRLVEAEMEDDK